MKVVVNQAALTAFFENPEGKIAINLEHRATRVRNNARRRVGRIMHRYSEDVASQVGYRKDPGPQFVLGIRDEGHISVWLADKELHPKEGTSPWLREALRREFPL